MVTSQQALGPALCALITSIPYKLLPRSTEKVSFARAMGSAPFMTLSTSFVAGLSIACFFTFLPGRLPPLWLCQYHFRAQQYKLLITTANTYIVLTVYKALFEVLYSSAEFILTLLVLVQLVYEAGDIVIPICNGKTITERLINLTKVKF